MTLVFLFAMFNIEKYSFMLESAHSPVNTYVWVRCACLQNVLIAELATPHGPGGVIWQHTSPC